MGKVKISPEVSKLLGSGLKLPRNATKTLLSIEAGKAKLELEMKQVLIKIIWISMIWNWIK